MMQRYHATSAVNNNSAISGIQARDTSSRADSSTAPPNFSLNSRRSSKVASYELRCEKEQLNPRLGPPDFHPQSPDCPEETLTREYAQSGYRDTVEGLEESREISLSQVQASAKVSTFKYKEAIRKCHRAINESRAQKRKAGQVYGVPLSGTLLTKPGVFPDQRTFGEDFRRKWIEGLSQPHKRLRSLADQVPHGFRRNSLFEVLIRNNVPLLRATWFIKVTYLNQIRASTSSSSSGFHEKSQFSRSEQWTRDVIEYLKYLLDEFITRSNSHSTFHIRDRPTSQMVYNAPVHQKGHPVSPFTDGEEPTLYTKWWYMVRIIHWHHAEGLLLPSLIIDWVLNQLQEKELLGVLQLLLPIIYGVIETVILSQTYVRTLVGIGVRFSQEPSSPGGSDLVDNSRRAYTTSAVVEMLRYLILAVPDTFVALDCFPLPKCVTSFVVNDGSFLAKTVRDGSQMEVSGIIRDKVHAESLSFLSVVTSIQSRAETLSRAARPNHPRHNVAKALQALDQALIHGDIEHAYNLLWEDIWNGTCTNQWIAEISPCLFTSLKQISKVTSSLICSVFLICEWATCEFRDFRNAPPHGLKFTGRKDFSQIFIAIRLLKLKMSNMQNPNRKKEDIFEGRGPLHDVIVCWIDQHEVHNTEGFNRLQLLVRELIQSGIFTPHAYVRQLIVSGIMDGNRPVIELERRRRHHKLLKKLTAPYVSDLLREGQIGEPQTLDSSASIYSNERRVILHGLSGPGISTPHVGNDFKLKELKALISSLLQLPMDSGVDEPGGINSRTDAVEDTSGCDECRMVKRQKLNEQNLNPADEEESWWDNKALLKYAESFKPESPLLKPPIKQASRGRQKSVRKTQSLAQLAAARIEGSQGASTSHVCESKVGCPNHRSGFDSAVKTVDGKRKLPTGDIVSIGEFLKKLRFSEKRSVTQWLISFIKKVIEEGEKTPSKAGQARQYPAADDRSSLQWRLGEDELSAILFLLDICKEFVSAVRFLLWLLQKVPGNPVSTIHNRNIVNVTRATENHTFEVGDTFLLSCFRRYENIVVAADFIPDILSALMHRTTAVLASGGRLSSSSAFIYGRHLLKKYNNISSVVEWEKTFKLTCDKRLGSELESSGRSLEGFSLGAPNGVEDLDDYFRQKISSVRPSRVALSMKEIVHRHVDEAFQYFYSKDRKATFGSGINKTASIEKREDGFQIAYQIVTGLMDCMRQTGGAAQEGDPALVSSAIAAIVHNVGQVIARIPDLTASNNNYSNAPLPSSSLHFARRILRIHVTCLCILKEALGERQSHVFEVALASEASSALLQGFAPGKAYSNSNNDVNKPVHGKLARITSAVSALIIGAILQGVTSLERMVSLLRIKEGIDLVQFARSMKSNVNGNARSVGVLKMDNLIEVSVNWFRVLVGNCRTVSDGFIVELLGETSIVALLRMQRVLSPKLVFPPAYSIFALVVWRPILESSFGVREDIHQLSAVAISDAIKHLPFRETCLRDTHGLYDLIAADSLDSEFLTLLESTSSGINLKAAALVPLRARLFLDSLLDCKMSPVVKIDEGKLVNGQVELKKRCAENVKRLAGKLVNVLDTLQPARFHWQWLELRLLLNEQAVNEKMMENDISLAEAVRSVSSSNHAASEYESHFVQIILTRLLVRPDAAPLFAEIVHLLGKSLEDSMLSQAKWLLRGAEVLYGKKSIRQKVLNIAADLKEPSSKSQYWKPWGWCRFDSKKMEKVKSDLEEGEVDEGHFGKGSGILDVEGFIVSQQHVTERALIEIILPCVDRGSDELRNNFASEMIKQMSNIEQQINSVTRGVSKPVVTPTPATGGPPTKSRKGGKSGSPGIIPRQPTVSTETVPPSPAALRASMTLRLHILLRLLPIICADREPSGRNMRYTLASVILRLLGSRVVHEDPTHFVNPALISSKREVEPSVENLTANTLLCGENLFDCFLLVLHVLLSSNQPSWLKSRSESKSIESHRSYVVFDREVAESLQNELERMDLPDAIRWRIQTAMPVLFPSARRYISCQPESISASVLSCLQPSTPVITLNPKNTNPPQRNPLLPGRVISSLKFKPNQLPQQQDLETENDPWTLLEEGAGSSLAQPNLAGISGSDPANLKASNFLKGAVRVRRTDLSYIGTVDEDS